MRLASAPQVIVPMHFSGVGKPISFVDPSSSNNNNPHETTSSTSTPPPNNSNPTNDYDNPPNNSFNPIIADRPPQLPQPQQQLNNQQRQRQKKAISNLLNSLPQDLLPPRQNIFATHTAPKMILDGNTMMGTYLFKTENAVECGARFECSLTGMIKATFSDRNKIADIEMVFDIMSMVHQLNRASGDAQKMEGVCPNTRISVKGMESGGRPLIIVQNGYKGSDLKITYANAAAEAIQSTKYNDNNNDNNNSNNNNDDKLMAIALIVIIIMV